MLMLIVLLLSIVLKFSNLDFCQVKEISSILLRRLYVRQLHYVYSNFKTVYLSKFYAIISATFFPVYPDYNKTSHTFITSTFIYFILQIFAS